jgi:hypothetical protein
MTMRAIKHPLSGAIYGLEADGVVRVDKNGRTGRFRSDGTYISGDIYFADPHLCQWIGERTLPSLHRSAGEAMKRK